MQEQKEATVDIRSVLRLIYEKLGLILLITFVVTVLGAAYTFFIATPTYTASTQLVARLPDSDTSTAYAGQVTGNIQMANTINQVIVSPIILDKVQNNLGLTDDDFQKNVTSTNATNSQVITVTVKYSNPYTAQKIADETAKVFSDNAAKLLNVTNVSILSKAKLNTQPISPKPTIYILASIIIGLIISIAVAFLSELFNNKINSEEDIESLGFSVLGSTAYAEMKDFANIIGEKQEISSHTLPRDNTRRRVK